MSAFASIAAREFLAPFRTTAGAAVIALFLALCGGFVALAVLVPGGVSELRTFFIVCQWLALVVVPAISMRLVAEDVRTGTMEALMSTAASEWAIAAGKLVGGYAFFLVVLASTAVYPATLAAVAGIEWGAVASGYAGVALLGLAYMGVGVLVSSMTESQVVAFLGTFAFFVALWALTGPGARVVGPPAERVLVALSFAARLDDFARGVVNLADATFFVAVATVGLVATVVSVESRRWR